MSFRMRLAAAGITLLATVFALPAGAAMAGISGPASGATIRPASDSSCTSGINSDEVCVFISGSGLHVNSVEGTFMNGADEGSISVHIEISGPSGLIQNCSEVSLPAQDSVACTWNPNANEPAGSYCATGWEEVSGGKFEDIAESCAPVRS
jgi:hypothetical protein